MAVCVCVRARVCVAPTRPVTLCWGMLAWVCCCCCRDVRDFQLGEEGARGPVFHIMLRPPAGAPAPPATQAGSSLVGQ
jgi:hypothetical protein